MNSGAEILTTTVQDAEISREIEQLRAQFLTYLRDINLPPTPVALYEPLRYAIANPGKCLRPMLTICVGMAFGAPLSDLRDPALAIELLHTFSLVHDDIMDQASQRRGRETIHLKWNPNTAILTGDALLAVAFEILLRQPSRRQAQLGYLMAQAMRQICAGQALDIEFERRETVSPNEYLEMIRLKTGELLGLACQFGALIAGAPADSITQMQHLGIKLGQAFQVQDDLLEITAEVEQMGKSLISDIQTGKKTYPVILVLEQLSPAERRQWLKELQQLGGDRQAVRQAFEQFAVLEPTAELAESLFAEARTHLTAIPQERRPLVAQLVEMIAKRQS
jgi:geranylgeranyl diphosphate synthase type II